MKSDRIFLRASTETKEYLQGVAHDYFDGKISTVIDFLIERLDLHLEGMEIKNHEGGE